MTTIADKKREQRRESILQRFIDKEIGRRLASMLLRDLEYDDDDIDELLDEHDVG